MAIPTEKLMDWMFRVGTALVIPAIIWTFKVSQDIVIVKEKLDKIEKSIEELPKVITQVAVNKSEIAGVKKEADNIRDATARIEGLLLTR